MSYTYPVADCPPHGRPAYDGLAFRWVRSDPPDSTDFLRWIDEPGNGIHRTDTDEEICCKHGVSMFMSLRIAVTRFKSLPPQVRTDRGYKFVASGRVPAAAGEVKETRGKGHLSWWPSDDKNRAAHFKVASSL